MVAFQHTETSRFSRVDEIEGRSHLPPISPIIQSPMIVPFDAQADLTPTILIITLKLIVPKSGFLNPYLNF
jgi:hypothetical protein